MNADIESNHLHRKIRAVLEKGLGDRLAALYVFGSRALGQHRPDSDLDLAVVLRHVEQPLSAVDRELLDLIYPIEIEQGLHIQAWALSAESLDEQISENAEPGRFRARLAATVRREGIPL